MDQVQPVDAGAGCNEQIGRRNGQSPRACRKGQPSRLHPNLIVGRYGFDDLLHLGQPATLGVAPDAIPELQTNEIAESRAAFPNQCFHLRPNAFVAFLPHRFDPCGRVDERGAAHH